MQGSRIIGSNEFRNFGQFADIPEKLQAAMESGLSFFELRFQGEKRFNQNVFGFFDVDVERNVNTVRKNTVRYDTTWRTERDAKITFQCVNQNTGLSIAFMVDDPFWHNRMMMAFNPVYMIFAFHTREGQIPGSIIAGEIECLREICMEKGEQFAAINAFNRSVCSSFEEADVDEYIKMKKRPRGQPANLRKVKRAAYSTRPWVIDIIHNNERNQFGWTNSVDFNKKIKEPALRLIEDRGISRTIEQRATISQEQIQSMVERTLRSMSPDQIRAMLQKNSETTSAAGTGAEGTGPYPAAVEVEPEWKNRTFFLRLKQDPAKKMAMDRGIAGADTMTRQELCNALLSDEGKRKAQWEQDKKRKTMDAATGVDVQLPGKEESTGEDMIAQ